MTTPESIAMKTKEEVHPHLRELWLHNAWAQQSFSQGRLHTVQGNSIDVLFPGWYNPHCGPDFLNARILIDEIEHFGDVEIHINENSWSYHHHNQDPVYNKVILHVFLNQGSQRAQNEMGLECNSLNLNSTQVSREWQAFSLQNNSPIKKLPGACGLMAKEDKKARKINEIIFQASEQRLDNKAKEIEKAIREMTLSEQEDYLFALIAKAIGYSHNSHLFFQLAQRFPFSGIKFFLRLPIRQAKSEIFARWFGTLDLLSSIHFDQVPNELRREFIAIHQIWKESGQNKVILGKANRKGRPQNNPFRRLSGLFYHLHLTHFKGLIKTWLVFLDSFSRESLNSKEGLNQVIHSLDSLFPQAEGDPFASFLTLRNPSEQLPDTKFIGKQRQRVILINAIIPFFLAWARKNKIDSLEKNSLLFSLYYPEKERIKKTRFLEARLFSGERYGKTKKNLSYYQGLIHLYEECCHSFYEGCQNCSLLKLLQKTETP